MTIEERLATSVSNGLKTLYGAEVPAGQVQWQKTKKEFEGHLTLVVFPYLRMSRKSPEQTANELGEYLKQNETAVADFNAVKGFLNITIATSAWIERLNTIHSDAEYGLKRADEQAPLVMIVVGQLTAGRHRVVEVFLGQLQGTVHKVTIDSDQFVIVTRLEILPSEVVVLCFGRVGRQHIA